MSWMPYADPHRERVLFVGRDLAVGRFEMPAADPSFADTGPTRHHVLVFPEEPVWVEREAGAKEVADPRRVVLHNAGVPYRRRPIGVADRCWWIALRRPERLLPGVRPERPFSTSSVALPAGTLLDLHRLLARLGRDDPRAVERRVGGLVRKVVALGAQLAPADVPAAHRELSERTRARLGECFRDPVPVPRIAAAVAASPSHLSRVFRRATGQTVQDFRDDLRLRRALVELRRDPTRDLTALGLDLGYSSHSHFTAAFRKRFGCPPSSVRVGAEPVDGAVC